ncbi:radical SAM protein [Shewanella sp. Isolate13]|uniref:radical SAM protein n=1 Tax=Shewanella sp. Isolate13 TaxID=2908531 RepID=UPI001EFEC444|nr:radical SAM protein [Shewanella sp. Isolate13]MCG9731038.1 radical SAM protein [Shewanella sp. Isolate13]
MRYEGNIYRPPPEADAYILQCTIGCSYNKCSYCAMYKDVRYRVRTIDELKEDIRLAQATFGNKVEKVFLSDGDAISLPTESLLTILSELYLAFPNLNHVSTYAGPQSTLDKSLDEFRLLKEAGLTMTYLGVESGSDDVLKAIRKGVSSAQMLTAGQNIVQSGIKLVAMVMIGLGGSGEQSKQHAIQTAELINKMNPYLLGLLTTVAIEGTPLYRQVEKGDFTLLDPYEVLEEVKDLLQTLSREELLIDSTHGSNLLPMKGSLRAIRAGVFDKIDHTLLNRDSNIIGKAYLGRF